MILFIIYGLFIFIKREYTLRGVGEQKSFEKKTSLKPEEIVVISQRQLWFSREMTSEERAQKLHTDDVSLPRSGQCF